ncbi:MAG: tyrosine-type recombinase/integrase [Planctomycetota bacterium]
MIREMELRRFSRATHEAYLRGVKGLTAYYRRSPDQLSLEEVRSYVHYLIMERRLAASSTNQAAAAIIFFYRHVLGRAGFKLKIRQKASGRLPEPFSHQEVEQLIGVAPCLRDRVVLMTSYGTGMRVSEMVHLKCPHIESDRKLIRVEQGKRGKDRYTLLSPRLLDELRVYWKQVRSPVWVFPRAKDRNKPMGIKTAQNIFNACKLRARIERGCGIHTLRHSFAVHLLEAGVDVRTIQMLLGHADIKTTMRYLQVTQKHIASIRSPFDLLHLPNLKDLNQE